MSKPMAATASRRFAAVRKLPEVHSPVAWWRTAPSERGKNSYQAPRPARSRSTSSGYCSETVTRSRIGWRSTTAATSALKPAASRSSGVSDASDRTTTAIRSVRRSDDGRAGSSEASESRAAPSASISSTSMPASTFTSALWCQVPYLSCQASMTKDQLPAAGGVRSPSQRSVPWPAGPGRREPDPLPLFTAGIEEDGADAELVMAFTEGRGTHHHGFPRPGLWREFPAFDRRAVRR